MSMSRARWTEFLALLPAISSTFALPVVSLVLLLDRSMLDRKLKSMPNVVPMVLLAVRLVLYSFVTLEGDREVGMVGENADVGPRFRKQCLYQCILLLGTETA
mmetsp:Transcript_39802/g.76255  ORF Transcript_39802/g.76255 Transcript_39802/m.76255 type:complete len:103 (-) Transcript_39802:3-311(-)